MSALRHILNHPWFFWGLLCLPALPMLSVLSSGQDTTLAGLLHPTGEFAGRFLILTMMITPLTLLFKGQQWPRWLMKRRRYLGVASFAYALAHTVLYLGVKGGAAFAPAELKQVYIWSGWLAFVIFVPLAITSSDRWVKRLGRRWKTLQRFVYAAAVLTLLHWAALHNWRGITSAMVHFGPLIALEIYRLWYHLLRRRSVRVNGFKTPDTRG